MNRGEMLKRMADGPEPWDFIVIGGGATGLSTAIDAASRGYRTLLLEQSDFAKGTSSRSTKLVHGGVRYLQQGNVSLVLEALKERGLLRQNAPHLVKNLSFVVPNYDWWAGPFYGIGLRLYDVLAGKYGFGHSQNLSRQDTVSRIPTIETDGLRSGVIYYDGQFDDSRLAINMAQTAAEQGATVLNYVAVTGLCKTSGVVSGVTARDVEAGESFTIEARTVVNATGVFTDAVRQMDDPGAARMISPSQGVHIVLDKSFLPGTTAIMVPQTDDGRVLFAIPWHDRVVVGTTDTAVDGPTLDPVPLAEELDFLLSHAARYLTKDPTERDVSSAFAGLRPLVGAGGGESTASLSRDHVLHISTSGLVTITGGKWTTCRKMAEDTVDQASVLAQLEMRPCVTRDLHIHGFHKNAERFGDLAIYGSDAPSVADLFRDDPSHSVLLHPDLPIRTGEVVWAVRQEMARTVEDFLARRTRALFLDARASIACAPEVARVMARELNLGREWEEAQVTDFEGLAGTYLPKGHR